MVEDGRRILAERGWLAATPPAFRRAILDGGQMQTLNAGELFSRAGERGHGIWGVLEGQVSLTSALNGPDAPPSILLHPGHWAGYLPLFDRPRVANGQAVTDSRILVVPYAKLRAVLAADPGAWHHIAVLLLNDSMRFATLAVDLMIKESDRRVAAVLLDQAGCRQQGDGATVYLSQSQLGDMLTLSRHPVATILSAFAARGWVACGYRTMTVLDAAALRRLANGA